MKYSVIAWLEVCDYDSKSKTINVFKYLSAALFSFTGAGGKQAQLDFTKIMILESEYKFN